MQGVKPHSGEGSGWCISLVLREGASRAALDLVLPNRSELGSLWSPLLHACPQTRLRFGSLASMSSVTTVVD